MIGKRFITGAAFIAGISMLFLLCAEREEDMGSRNNPCDPGGKAWTKNAQPEVRVTIDSLWADFNHGTAKGIYRLYLDVHDRNFPYDTVCGVLSVNSSVQRLPLITQDTSLIITLADLRPDTVYPCTITVVDIKKDTAIYQVVVTTKVLLPPLPPSGSVTSGPVAVTISWPRIPDADSYIIYYSSVQTGPFTDSISVVQPVNGSITVSDTPGTYTPRYYVLSSVNGKGVSRALDTLFGRIYSTDLTAPTITQSSRGGYDTYTSMSLNIRYSISARYVEIYRSSSAAGVFRLIDTMRIFDNSTLYFNDSVTSADTFYYKAFVIDNIGRSSPPSAISSNYLRRLSQPVGVSLTQSNNALTLTWNAVIGASYYQVYRSSQSCSDNQLPIDSMSVTRLVDTPPSADLYYYTVCAVNGAGMEGTRSVCQQGKLPGLPAPEGFKATMGIYARHVALSWKHVPGAMGYVIYRNAVNSISTPTPIDTTNDTLYVDSISKSETWYYRVGALDNRGVGVLSDYQTGMPATPPAATIQTFDDSIVVSWGSSSYALRYYIYRSVDSTVFKLIDSSSTPRYRDLPNDYSIYFYRVSVLLSDGESPSGTIISGSRSLAIPEGLNLTNRSKGVLLQWNRVKNALTYQLYRSQSSGTLTEYVETTDTFFIDTSLSTSGFYYRVGAKNGQAKSPVSDAVIGGKTGTLPLKPATIGSYGIDYAVHIMWTMSPASPVAEGFYVYRSKSNTGMYSRIASTKIFEYYDTVPDTLYYFYKISAFNASGEGPLTTELRTRREPPRNSGNLQVPGNVTATMATSKEHIRISWSAIASVNEYGIYRALSLGGVYEYIGSAYNATTYDDRTCGVNTTYYYVVCSKVSGTKSDNSKYAAGIRLGPPRMLTSTLNKINNTYTFWWENVQYPVVMYYIYHSYSYYGAFTKIDSSTSTEYVYSKNPDTSNFFRVSAFTQVESDPSAIMAYYEYLPAAPPPTRVQATQGTEQNQITLYWTPAERAGLYLVYRAPTDSFNRNIKQVGGTNDTTYSDTVSSDSIYFYKVTSYNSQGESGFSAGVTSGFRSPSRLPKAPTTLYLISQTNEIRIGWSKPPTTMGYNGFNIYRVKMPNEGFQHIGYTTDTYYSDITAEKEPVSYEYYVSAVNSLGDGDTAGPLSASMK